MNVFMNFDPIESALSCYEMRFFVPIAYLTLFNVKFYPTNPQTLSIIHIDHLWENFRQLDNKDTHLQA